jgi:sugar phosphate isomerase/epimerase
MKIKEVIHPSILISEMFYPYVGDSRKLCDIVKKIAGFDYYRGIEIGLVNGHENMEFVRRMVEGNRWQLTMWITQDLLEQGLNPSSIDKEVHQKTILRLKELVQMAGECGASNLAMISCDDPGEKKRAEAKNNLYEVMVETCREMEGYPEMNLLIEPLDRAAHKKNLIGPTDESVEFLTRLRREYQNIYFSWDSAHVALNNEDLQWSLEISASYISQIHLANAVVDPKSGLYGDWHMHLGVPGFLNSECAARLLKKAAVLPLPNRIKHYVSVEVRCKNDDMPWENEKKYRIFLNEILEKEVEKA